MTDCCPPQITRMKSATPALHSAALVAKGFADEAPTDAEPTLLTLREIFEALSDPSFAIEFAIERRLAS